MKFSINSQELVIATFNQVRKLNIDPATIINIPLSRKPKNDLWTGICSELGIEFDFNVILNIKAKWKRNQDNFYINVSSDSFNHDVVWPRTRTHG